MKSRYQSLLRTSGTSSEVAEFLYPVSGLGPVDDAANIFNLCKNEMHNLIYASLDFIHFKNEDGEFHNVIPEELKIDIKERVENEYQAFIDGLDVERMVNDAESAVLARVEHYAWHKGIKVLPEALEKMTSNLTRCAEEYENMDVPVDDAALIASYEEALKHTLRERLSGTNSDDVLTYRLEMIEYLEKVCSVRMYRAFERFFSILACSSVFVDVKTKLENIREYLLKSGVTGHGTSCLKDRSEGPYEAVFTDLKEHDPEKTLRKFSELISNNM